MNLTEEVVVLSVSRYSFVSDEGQQMQGTTVWYHAVNPVSEDNRVGCVPTKANLPLEAFETMKAMKFPVPATANITVDLSRGKLKVSGFSFNK